jgi:hypothetical protein
MTCFWNRVFFLTGWVVAVAAWAPAEDNLLVNPGFEQDLLPAWEQRTPEDAQRKLYRSQDAGRSGAAVVLENVQPAYTRLRQGHDRSISIPPGSLIELSAWVKSEQEEAGVAMLQVYCMDDQDKILSQPTSQPVPGAFDWTRHRLLTVVPEGTAYVMAYLQTRDGVGRVWFDDVALVVRRGPVPRSPAPKIALLTDLPDDDATIQEARVLFEEGLTRVENGQTAIPGQAAGALVLYQGEVPASLWPSLVAFARGGGRVFMDIRALARCHGARAVSVELVAGRPSSLAERMQAGLRVVQQADATAGFAVGQVMPRAGWPEAQLLVLPADFTLPDLKVLAVAPGGQAGLVQLAVGEGMITACDVLSLRQPSFQNVDAYYKFTPASGALGNPVRFGQYYPRKLPYDQVVAHMKELARTYPAISIQLEGPASQDYQIWSLNLGTPGKPLYFLYAAAHGSEWEPGYGLMTLAQRLAEGELRDVVDLDRVRIKIIPVLNPWGYDQRRRQNAQGVDLNRQGDYQWQRFQGRDSTMDGVWGPGDYDWKGAAPWSEPEAQVVRRIAELPELYCILDFHGNTSATSNKIGILPVTARPDNELMALDLQQIVNQRLRGRHLLRQNEEETVSTYLLDRVRMGGGLPYLMNTAARDKHGLLIELTAGYGESYGTVLQTDVTCEMCRALFLAYPPPDRPSGREVP